jgi:hypothetical protein
MDHSNRNCGEKIEVKMHRCMPLVKAIKRKIIAIMGENCQEKQCNHISYSGGESCVSKSIGNMAFQKKKKEKKKGGEATAVDLPAHHVRR